jgi:hypothetical protein
MKPVLRESVLLKRYCMKQGTAESYEAEYDRDDKGAKAGPPSFQKEIRSFGSGAKESWRR